MSFCRNCGAKLSDTSMFCSSCGSKVDDCSVTGMNQVTAAAFNRYNNAMNAGSLRKMQIAEAEKVYQYFITKRDKYEELINCQKRMESIKAPKKYYLISLVGLEAVYYFFSSGHTIGGILSLIATVAIFILWRNTYRKKTEKCDEVLESTQDRIDAISNELGDYYDRYDDCPIGPEYTFPSVLNELMDYVHSGRADSLKEAINIMITDGRLANMEMNTASAAAGAQTAAVFSALNFFFN